MCVVGGHTCQLAGLEHLVHVLARGIEPGVKPGGIIRGKRPSHLVGPEGCRVAGRITHIIVAATTVVGRHRPKDAHPGATLHNDDIRDYPERTHLPRRDHCMHARLRLFAIALMLTACEPPRTISADISDAFKKSGNQYVDFSALQGEAWTKVCFLGPYNTQSSQTLGFEWDITAHTDVLNSDGHNVILFATDAAVIAYAVHERNREDFWQLSGQCFPRQRSTLFKDTEKGWRTDSGH